MPNNNLQRLRRVTNRRWEGARNNATVPVNHTNNSMRIVSENEDTAASIRAELERLYAAACYLNADSAKISLVVNLIEAAIAELDRVTAEKPPLTLRLVQNTE